MMNIGRTVLISFDQDGKHYDLITIKNTDLVITWLIQLFEGTDSWKNYQTYGEPITVLDETYNVDIPQTIEGAKKKVQIVINQINIFFKNKFTGSISMTWIEMLESILTKVVFFGDANGIPQVKIQE